MNTVFVKERITQLRIQKGVSEYRMSYDLGHSRGYINNISSGKTLPSMTEFFSICEYFDISPLEFFDNSIHSPAQLSEAVRLLEQVEDKDLTLIISILRRILQS